MNEQEKEIWIDDAQWEGMMEGKQELEWLLRQVNEDIERCERDDTEEYNRLIEKKIGIMRELNCMNKMMLRVHHVDELV